MINGPRSLALSIMLPGVPSPLPKGNLNNKSQWACTNKLRLPHSRSITPGFLRETYRPLIPVDHSSRTLHHDKQRKVQTFPRPWSWSLSASSNHTDGQQHFRCTRVHKPHSKGEYNEILPSVARVSYFQPSPVSGLSKKSQFYSSGALIFGACHTPYADYSQHREAHVQPVVRKLHLSIDRRKPRNHLTPPSPSSTVDQLLAYDLRTKHASIARTAQSRPARSLSYQITNISAF